MRPADSVKVVEEQLVPREFGGNKLVIVPMANALIREEGERCRQCGPQARWHQFRIEERMRQRSCSLARNGRDRPREVGMGQVVPLMLRDCPQPDIDLAELVALGGNEVEQVAVDETVEIGRQLHGGLFSQAGKIIDTMAGSNLDAMPKQHLAYGDGGYIAAGQIDADRRNKPHHPWRRTIERQLPASGRQKPREETRSIGSGASGHSD
jgi:hypothetical protein